MNAIVEEVIMHDDDTVTVVIDMDVDTRDLLVKIGLMYLIRKAAEDGYTDTEGAGDTPSGTQGG